jgi:hypothetical protein
MDCEQADEGQIEFEQLVAKLGEYEEKANIITDNSELFYE